MRSVIGLIIGLLIGPGTLTIFGLGFLWAWSLERKRHCLLLLTAGCMKCFSVFEFTPLCMLQVFFYDLGTSKRNASLDGYSRPPRLR